ncbi:MAG: hypothetical protein ABI672_16505 [Vicinamibacteria bacterium]
MGADEVAAIRPVIAELEVAALEQPGEPAQFYGSFSVAAPDGPWVEVYLEQETMVNLWYPFQEEPLHYLAMLGVQPLPGARVVEPAPPSCLLAFDRVPSHVLAKFIDSLFTSMYGCGEGYEIDVEVKTFA